MSKGFFWREDRPVFHFFLFSSARATFLLGGTVGDPSEFRKFLHIG
jgi:hypothetical protein